MVLKESLCYGRAHDFCWAYNNLIPPPISIILYQNPAAVLNYAGYTPGVGSRSSTRCSPLDFLEVATVVPSKAQESGNCSRESAAVAAAEGLAVLAAAGEAAAAAAAAASVAQGSRASPPGAASGKTVSRADAAAFTGGGKDGGSRMKEDGADTVASAAGVGTGTEAAPASSTSSSAAAATTATDVSRKERGDKPPLTKDKESGKKGAGAVESVAASSPAITTPPTSNTPLSAPEAAAPSISTANGDHPSGGAPSSQRVGITELAVDEPRSATTDATAKAAPAGEGVAARGAVDGAERGSMASSPTVAKGVKEKMSPASPKSEATVRSPAIEGSAPAGAGTAMDTKGPSSARTADDVAMTDVADPAATAPKAVGQQPVQQLSSSAQGVALSDAPPLAGAEGARDRTTPTAPTDAVASGAPKPEADQAGTAAAPAKAPASPVDADASKTGADQPAPAAAETAEGEGEGGPAKEQGPAAAGKAAKKAGVVAPRGLVRRDGNSGAACKMCKSKWDRDQTLVCCSCLMHYHPDCLDPPMGSKEVRERKREAVECNQGQRSC